MQQQKFANADSFIHKLPNGYDTVLTGDGANFQSGAETAFGDR